MTEQGWAFWMHFYRRDDPAQINADSVESWSVLAYVRREDEQMVEVCKLQVDRISGMLR